MKPAFNTPLALATASMCFVGCTTERDQNLQPTGGIVSAGPSEDGAEAETGQDDGAAPTTGGTGNDGSDDDATGGGIKLDVGPAADGTTEDCIERSCEASGCVAVDLLFVIDNSEHPRRRDQHRDGVLIVRQQRDRVLQRSGRLM